MMELEQAKSLFNRARARIADIDNRLASITRLIDGLDSEAVVLWEEELDFAPGKFWTQKEKCAIHSARADIRRGLEGLDELATLLRNKRAIEERKYHILAEFLLERLIG